ncbi:MAG: GIY-YIG nuclease family protein [Patescibacteria group bacterium]
MYYVYILYSKKDKNFYTGYTHDLRRRYLEHQNGLVESTCSRRPILLIYYEAYISKNNAEQREIFYKSGRGRETLLKILKETLEGVVGEIKKLKEEDVKIKKRLEVIEKKIR